MTTDTSTAERREALGDLLHALDAPTLYRIAAAREQAGMRTAVRRAAWAEARRLAAAAGRSAALEEAVGTARTIVAGLGRDGPPNVRRASRRLGVLALATYALEDAMAAFVLADLLSPEQRAELLEPLASVEPSIVALAVTGEH